MKKVVKRSSWRKKALACLAKGRVKTQTSQFYKTLSAKLLSLGYIQEYQIEKYFVDFALPENKVVIECDNQHLHKKTYWIARDRRRELRIERLGWKFIRVPEPRKKEGIAI